MSELMVASAGGHLRELSALVASTARPSTNGIWVTYVTAVGQVSRAIVAHHPTTKNIPNAVRNYRLARRVFAEHHIERVISTGAAVAVPFMLRARQLGIPCHYIESATRVDGPSLSGRLVARLPGVKLYRQLGTWGEPRWQQGPCVFDAFRVTDGSASAEASLPDAASSSSAEADGAGTPRTQVVVSLGTHRFAFPALVEQLRRELGPLVRSDPDHAILWQLGSTPDPGDLPGRVVGQLPHDELEVAVAEADVVVGHAGVGLALTALRAGTVPVLVPRRRARREHTDDHQVQLARELERRGLAITAEVGELSREHLERASSFGVRYDQPPPFELVD